MILNPNSKNVTEIKRTLTIFNANPHLGTTDIAMSGECFLVMM